MSNLSDMYSSLDIGSIIFIIVILIIMAALFYLFYRRSKNKKNNSTYQAASSLRNATKKKAVEQASPDKNNKKEESKEAEKNEQESKKEGIYPAYVCKKDSLDYRLIPESVGQVWMADPSMPKSGDCYLVKEDGNGNGNYIAYDPREEPLSKDTPQLAWFATHWEIVKGIFTTPTQWWHSTSMWISIAVGLAAFIIVLATVGD